MRLIIFSIEFHIEHNDKKATNIIIKLQQSFNFGNYDCTDDAQNIQMREHNKNQKNIKELHATQRRINTKN